LILKIHIFYLFMQVEITNLPVSQPTSQPSKGKKPALLILGVGVLLLATVCSFYYFSQSSSLGASLNFMGNSDGIDAERRITSSEECANGLTAYTTGLTQAQQDEVLKAHNVFRSTVATGQTPNQPGATDMLEMIWDDDLAEKAQSWADQCVFDHDTNSDRETATFNYVGQNLVLTEYSSKKKAVNLTKMIGTWYDEVKKYSGAAPVKKYKYNANTGHYTQLVWGNSYALGCGFKKYQDSGMYTYQLTCNYGPGGNTVGTKIYTEGTFAAAKCKNGASSTYQGLCNH